MKKFICLLLSALFLTNSLCLTAFASDSANPAPLYVLSAPCSEDIISQIVTQAPSLIMSAEESSSIPLNTQIGHPFSYTDGPNQTFFFPVFINGLVKYTIRVTPSGSNYYGTISDFLVDELNSLYDESQTNESSPASFYVDGNQLMLDLGESTTCIYEFLPHENIVSSSANLQSLIVNSPVTLTAQNISDPLPLPDVPVLAYNNTSYVYLDTTRETQGSETWCMAYCVAILARLRGYSNCVAETVMSYFFGSNPSTTATLSDARAAEYAHAIGLSNVVSYGGYLDTFTIKSLLGGDTWDGVKSPLILSMYRPATNSYHATVLRGYNTSSWSIWNPWYSDYESFTIGGYYTARNGSVFQYNGTSNAGRTIYNW